MRRFLFAFFIFLFLAGCSGAPSEYLQKGHELAGEGDYKGAFNYYTHVIKEEPDSPEAAAAHLDRGVLLYRAGKLRMAIADIDKSIKSDDFSSFKIPPDKARAIAYFYRGLIYDEVDKLDEALADYNKAIRLFPELAPAYFERARILRNEKAHESALMDLEMVTVLAPSYKKGMAYGVIAENYYNEGNYKEAEPGFTNMLKYDPGNAEIYLERGDTYVHLKKYDLAKDDYVKAVAYSKSDETAEVALARLKRLRKHLR